MPIEYEGVRPDMEKNAHAAPPASEQNYEAALADCAAGERAAVAKIYQFEHRKLRGVVGRIVRDRSAVEDVIHDAFVQILRDAASFDPARGSARTWIYAIVRNTALKRMRNAGRELATADEKLKDICDSNQLALDEDGKRAEYAALRDCLVALSPQRRATLVLAIIDGRTHAEVAACLGVPLGTVKSWIRRELVALRAQLK